MGQRDGAQGSVAQRQAHSSQRTVMRRFSAGSGRDCASAVTAGHGSLEVTSRYAAILDERDTTLADALEEIFDHSLPATGRHQDAEEHDHSVDLLSTGNE
jgi:hypothetical protein